MTKILNEQVVLNVKTLFVLKHDAQDNLSFYKQAYVQAKENGNEVLIARINGKLYQRGFSRTNACLS